MLNGDGAASATGLSRVASPLRDQVLNVIRQAILNLDLKPGQRLIERELVEQLDVSRTTIREVLALLVSEGFVTIIPQQGAIVSVLSPSDAADIYDMRAALEALAVERFVQRATPAHVTRLREALQVYARAVEEEDSTRLTELRAKDQFYAVLMEGAASPPLSQVLAPLQGRVQALRATSLREPGRAKEAAVELARVVDLIEAGDAAKAAEAAAEHVRNAGRVALSRLSDTSGEATPEES